MKKLSNTKGLIILGPAGSGKTRLAESIAKTHRKSKVLKIDGGFEFLPWGIGNCTLFIVDGIGQEAELNRLLHHLPKKHIGKTVLVTQLPLKTITSIDDVLTNWTIRELTIQPIN